MLDSIQSIDEQLFIYLNQLGTKSFDPFWLFITHQLNWIPYYLILAILLYKTYIKKELLLIIFIFALTIIFSDQTSNLFKYFFQRLRPCNREDLIDTIRILKCSPTYSFFSAHASTSSAVSLLLYFLLKPYYKNLIWLLIFPILFGYSRIYIGMHFPIDILFGYCIGIILSFFMFKLYQKLHLKLFNPSHC